MAYTKVSKEQWLKLTKPEQDYLTLEFNKSIEQRKKWTIIGTRLIAIIFIGALFYMGYVQLQSVRNYNEKIDKYGVNGFCALCGEYSLKKCECQYETLYNAGSNKPNDINLTKIGNELSEYNVQACKPYYIYKEEQVSQILNWNRLNVTK